jgi:putative intracellular protease/amidase
MSTAYLIIFEGWADYQTSLACAEIARRDGRQLRIVGLTREPVPSISGLRVDPELTISGIDVEDACLLILPGGPLWEERDVPEVTALVRTFRERDIPIAAIGSGTLVLARAGVLGSGRHTSNSLAYLKSHVPEYRDDAHYVNVVDVADAGLITAHEGGHVDFAHEIIKILALLDEPERRTWYRLHREGVVPN